MQDNSLIDSIDNVDIDTQLKFERKKTLIKIGMLILFNTIMFVILIKNRDFWDKLSTSLNANLIGFNMAGFLLGAIVAIFPYKGLSYNKKYLRASLLTIFVLQTIMAIMLILIALMTFLGLY